MSLKMRPFSALIVDPDIEARMRLKQATSVTPLFSSVHQFSNLRDALSSVRESEHCDITFISKRLSGEDIQAFIQEARKTRAGGLSAYVLLLDERHRESTAIASMMVHGLDGFLFEPYSVEHLTDITELATRVHTEQLQARTKVAVKLLLNNIIEQLDMLSSLKSVGIASTRGMNELKRLISSVRALGPEAEAVYLEIVPDCFCEAPLPRKLFSVVKYRGASERVKKKLEEKLLTEIAERRKAAEGSNKD